jgi:hypothetical protein
VEEENESKPPTKRSKAVFEPTRMAPCSFSFAGLHHGARRIRAQEGT